MKILVTNDDGIHAKGLSVLVSIAKKLGEVYVVAPLENNSAVGHGITLRRALQATHYDMSETKCAVALNGTPADCVKYALSHLNIEPDIVLSGINSERNCGTDILYSGTVSAAIEANICGYKAMALSSTDEYYDVVEKEFPYIFEQLMAIGFDEHTTMNINFPNLEKSKGIKITTVGETKYEANYIEQENGHLLSGPFIDIEQPEETDVKSVQAGFVSITPLKFKLYEDAEIKRLQDALSQ